MIYRIEHKDTGLGPFEHGNQDVLKRNGIPASIDFFPELDIDIKGNVIQYVRDLINDNKEHIRFGFTNLNLAKSLTFDQKVVDECGFIIKEYDVEPLYVHESGHVIFLKPVNQ